MEPILEVDGTADGPAARATGVRAPARDGYTGRRAALSLFFFVMCIFRDAIFITGPILVYRIEGSLKSSGIYGSALLLGGMVSFLVSGVLLDRVGWKRVAVVAGSTLALTNGFFAATALGLVPYQRELDITLLVVVFFSGTVFYLVPDLLITRLLRAEDRPGSYARSGSLFPGIALMLTSTLLFAFEHVAGVRGLGLTLATAGVLAGLGTLLVARLPGGESAAQAGSTASRPRGVKGVLGEWLSGFRFVAADPVMRLLLVFNCCLALAIAPHSVFITAILKSSFHLDDGGVAIAQFTLASVQVLAALALPGLVRVRSTRFLSLTAVSALFLGNGLAAITLLRRSSLAEGGALLLGLYVTAHVLVFVGLTFATAWIRIVRGQSTPASLLGRTVGAMSTTSQLFGLSFSLVVSFVGAAIATHFFYLFCVAVCALVGAPVAIAVARRTDQRATQGA
jgi:hypothetical protein